MIVMKRAQTLMPAHTQSEPLRDPLYREIAKLLKFYYIPISYIYYNFACLFIDRIIQSDSLIIRWTGFR